MARVFSGAPGGSLRGARHVPVLKTPHNGRVMVLRATSCEMRRH